MKYDIDVIKDDILRILLSVKRQGIDDIVRFMIDNGFFELPLADDNDSSNNCAGCLAIHSYCVYESLKKLNLAFDVGLQEDSMIIVSLLHDLCRMDIQNSFPAGHGEKSVFMIQKFIHLTDDEILAINSHMGFCDARINMYNEFQKAYDMSKLTLFLFLADQIAASYICNQRYANQKYKRS